MDANNDNNVNKENSTNHGSSENSASNSIVTTMSIRMQVEIHMYELGLMRGFLHSQYLDEPYEFFSFVQMIGKIDEIFDSKQFPQAYMSPRSFSGKRRIERSAELKSNDSADDIRKQLGENENEVAVCTFKISVKFRQNATWQGNLAWVEKNLNQDFRSVLEMLSLMDEALLDKDSNLSHNGWDDN